MTRGSNGLPVLYSWDVKVSARGGAGGVTDDPKVAVRRVDAVLVDAPPGACGVVRKVLPSTSGRIVYVDLGEVGRAWWDGRRIVWTAR
ncbi:hypothetical protein [Actinomadura fibrosa]|uniref:Uncharacterized protein n=1 Tax=Actinomadura fibrosa TaxID=111802 RepID=A0ABW2XAR1_9ACTN|nr:hypothetical protein [Actinomadura fibrosa]